MNKYLLEPVLSSELILLKNARKLKNDNTLLHESDLDRIEELREEFYQLDILSNQGEKGLQKQKRQVRDEITDLSSRTYTNRDNNLFGTMITTMADKIVSRPQFSNYTYKDEMKSLAIQHILSYCWNFDPYKVSDITNQPISAFAYISTIIFNACIATINKQKKEQDKSKESFLEHQKLIHRDPNASTIGADFEDAKQKRYFPNLEQGALFDIFHKDTITESTEFWVPEGYKISEKELNFCLKYVHNISIRRIKGPNAPDVSERD